MEPSSHLSASLVCRIQKFLPLQAHARPQLRGRLAGAAREDSGGAGSGRLFVLNVFDTKGLGGLMCRVSLAADAVTAPAFVVPITHVAFDRRHPISQEIAHYRRQRARQL